MIPDFLKIKKHRCILNYYLIWLPFIMVYQVTNRFHLFEPRLLPMSRLDEAIPFLSWTIPVYVSYLVYTFVVITRSRDDDEVRQIFVFTHIQLAVAALFFIFFPVTYPREGFYYTEKVTSMFNGFWLMFDEPNNCFPSLHTMLCLTAIRYSMDKPGKWLYCAWGALIIATTLTCKQHYVIDIAGAFAAYWLSLKIFSFYCSRTPGKRDDCPPSQSSQ